MPRNPDPQASFFIQKSVSRESLCGLFGRAHKRDGPRSSSVLVEHNPRDDQGRYSESDLHDPWADIQRRHIGMGS